MVDIRRDPERERRDFIAGLRARARALGLAAEASEMTRARLDADDVTGEMRRRVCVLSIGNSCEAHGMALAPDIDDRSGAAIATRVACATGARYVGHVPYATDGVDDLARAWSPAFLPFDEFYAKTVDFVRMLFARFYDDAKLARPDLVLFVSGHGGNDAIRTHAERLAVDLGARRCLYSLSMRPDEGGIQHADATEHAVARALGKGCVDHTRLERAASEMTDDRSFFATLERHPALGGMAGFYVFGDARFDALRARYAGVKSSVRRFVDERAIGADEARGRAVIDETVRTIAGELLAAANDLGVAPPWFATEK
jgi:creatinine amidohydrolase/Fe(II)-dependent formamide hydrolase-like protein